MIKGERSAAATERRLAEMERRLHGIYTEAAGDIRRRWDDFLAPIDKELAKYQKMREYPGDADVRKKAEKEYRKVLKEKTLLNKRFRVVSKKIAAELANVNARALAYVNGELPPVFADNYNDITVRIGGDVAEFGGADINVRFDLIDEDTARLLATEDTSLLPHKELDKDKDVAWNVRNIRSEVLKGILIGEDIPSIAARMEQVIGMNEKAAIRNARTMVTGAQNSGRMEGMRRAEGMGVVLKRVWMSADDGRVRGAHRELDGQMRGMDEAFENALGSIMYPGDPNAHPANVYNCRCTLGTEIIGFRDPVTGKVKKV